MTKPIERLNYFTGQFLEKDDFIDEQSYHIDMRRRGNSALYFSAGILDDGFQVKLFAADNKKIEIGPGIAVDAAGRELVVVDPLVVDPLLHTKPTVDGQRYLVAMTYDDQTKKDRPQATGIGSDTEYTRIVEEPKVLCYREDEAFDHGIWVVVGAIHVKLDGTVSDVSDIDSRIMRTYAGARVPGRLGVGTSAPQQELSVLGGLNVDQANGNKGTLASGGLSFGDSSGEGFASARTANSPNQYGLDLYSRGLPRLSVLNDGRVGIGTRVPATNSILHLIGGSLAISEDQKLTRADASIHVVGGGGRLTQLSSKGVAKDAFNLVGSTNAGSGEQWWAWGVTTANKWRIRNSTDIAGEDGLSIDGSGQVGIGTSSPQAKLHVNGGGGGSVDLLVNGRLRSDNNDGGLWIASNRFVGGFEADKVGFYSANAWRLAVAADGKVGIGTTTPTARLSIVADGGTEIAGTAQSSTLKVSAGSLGGAAGSELTLASIGCTSPNNNSLGIRAYRFDNGATWETVAIGLGIDVDNTARVSDTSLWLHPSGRVGISTSTPQQKLDVNGGAVIRGGLLIAGSGEPNEMLNVQVPVAANRGMAVTPGITVNGFGSFTNISYTGTQSQLNVEEGFAATIRACDLNFGSVSRRGSPGRALVDEMNGTKSSLVVNYGTDWPNVRIEGAVVARVNSPSSRKLKENIGVLRSAVANRIVSALNPVTFRYLQDKSKAECLGFIAEDVPPEVASEDRESVAVNHIVAALTRVVKDQQGLIEVLEARVQRLEGLRHPG